MKNAICNILLAVLAFCISTSFAENNLHKTPSFNGNTKQLDKKESIEKISFMFVVSSKQAKITLDKSNKLQLEMDHTDLDHVIMFSDRPNRFTTQISVKHLKRIWHQGADSFALDPPNAVLIANETSIPIILELDSIDFIHQRVVFQFKPVGDQSNYKLKSIILNKVHLVIDPYSANIPPENYTNATLGVIESVNCQKRYGSSSHLGRQCFPERPNCNCWDLHAGNNCPCGNGVPCRESGLIIKTKGEYQKMQCKNSIPPIQPERYFKRITTGFCRLFGCDTSDD